MANEKRDVAIGGALAILLIILYFAIHHLKKPAPPVQENTTQDQPQDQLGGISYNMPPTLTLPPYNTGNSAPITIDSGTHSDGGGCGCNACSGGQTPTTTFGDMSNFWSDMGGSGINAPKLTTVQLPAIQNITIPESTSFIPPGALSFADWKAVEGIGTIAGTSFLPEGTHTYTATKRFNSLYENMPGADILKNAPDSTKYAIYKMLNGSQWRDADGKLQQKVIDYIYASTTTTGPETEVSNPFNPLNGSVAGQ